MKKKSLFALTTVVAALSIGILAGCSESGSSSSTSSSSEETSSIVSSEEETAGISYQFTGNYTDDTLTGLGYDYYILLNLYEDGSAHGSGYNILSMDSSAYASNSGFSENWWTGKWENTTNEEDVECIALNVSYGSDAKNIMSGSLLEGSFSYELYEASDGSITFTIDCPIFSGRTQEITGSSSVAYADYDAFIQGNLYSWSAPESLVVFESAVTDTYAAAYLYLQSGGNALFYKGIQDPATSNYQYLHSETWTWSYSESSLSLNTGSATIDATISGTAASFDYTYSIYGYETYYSFSCSDISALIGTEAATAICTFTDSTYGATLAFYADNTAILSAYSGVLTINYTWVYSDSSLVLTDVENSSSTLTAVIGEDGKSATITYSANLGGYEISFSFVCDDISALIATEKATAICTFTDTAGYGATLDFYADYTAVMSVAGYGFSYTWAYADGSLSVTDTSSNTYVAVIDGTSATINLTLYGNSLTFTCSDISALIG